MTKKKTRITTIWPAKTDWTPGRTANDWRQRKRWLVLDITAGLDNAVLLERCASRATACSRSLALRAVGSGKSPR